MCSLLTFKNTPDKKKKWNGINKTAHARHSFLFCLTPCFHPNGICEKKRDQAELNRRPIGLQPIALPLSYSPRMMSLRALSRRTNTNARRIGISIFLLERKHAFAPGNEKRLHFLEPAKRARRSTMILTKLRNCRQAAAVARKKGPAVM